MTPALISAVVVADRVAWIRRMLEALLDLGRYILAKGFARGISEYKAIATTLAEESRQPAPAAGAIEGVKRPRVV